MKMNSLCTVGLLTLLAAGCARTAPDFEVTPADAGEIAFPIGTYTTCAMGTYGTSGLLNITGFESDTALTVAQSGETVTATYVEPNGVSLSVRFSVTTGTSATLAPTNQVIPGLQALCVVGLGVDNRFPALMDVTDGELTYDERTVFVTLTGSMVADAGCAPAAPANLWIVCVDRQGGAFPLPDAGTSLGTSKLPVGQYECLSEIGAYEPKQYASGGGTGTLVLVQDDKGAAVQYLGDKSVWGTLPLVVTTSKTATVEAGQTLTTACMVPISSPPTNAPANTLITAGSLSFDDTTLFLSFAGVTDPRSACPGAHVAGNVICTRQ